MGEYAGLERSTRSIKLTDLGQEFYLHCQAMIAEAEAAEETAARELGLPRGKVRVDLVDERLDRVRSKLDTDSNQVMRTLAYSR